MRDYIVGLLVPRQLRMPVWLAICVIVGSTLILPLLCADSTLWWRAGGDTPLAVVLPALARDPGVAEATRFVWCLTAWTIALTGWLLAGPALALAGGLGVAAYLIGAVACAVLRIHPQNELWTPVLLGALPVGWLVGRYIHSRIPGAQIPPQSPWVRPGSIPAVLSVSSTQTRVEEFVRQLPEDLVPAFNHATSIYNSAVEEARRNKLFISNPEIAREFPFGQAQAVLNAEGLGDTLEARTYMTILRRGRAGV